MNSYLCLKTENVKTVLCYAHMDKQPWGEGWDEDKKPTEPVIQNGKLYGRGGADDGYGTYSALCAIKACQDNGLPHPRVYIFVEGAEESRYKRVSILKIETTDEFAKYNKLIIKMDGLSALVWSKKTFSQLELNWDGCSSFRNKILHSFQISTSNPSCFFNTCRASSITIYIFNIFY